MNIQIFFWEEVMQSSTRRFIAIVAIGSGLMLPLNMAVAQTLDLSAQWAQWALSIPTSVNPQLDTTGQNCMVGQSGSIWFLSGVFGGGTVTRTCSVPADKVLFFPVANQVNFNSPGVCGLPNQTVAELRSQNADFVNGITSKSVKVDGQPVATPRIQSRVFEVALPEENIFDTACPPENVPAGIYSPAVVDGFYSILGLLRPGHHTVRIKAQNNQGFVQDVTYNLTVVPVTLQ
jgi:hypothetical protein